MEVQPPWQQQQFMAAPAAGHLRTQEEEIAGWLWHVGWMDWFSSKVTISGRRFEAASLKTGHQINVINNEIYGYDWKENLNLLVSIYFVQKYATSSIRLTVDFNYWKQLYFLMKRNIYTIWLFTVCLQNNSIEEIIFLLMKFYPKKNQEKAVYVFILLV